MSYSPIPNTEGQISSAINVLSTEYDQITKEIRAFKNFKKKVENTVVSHDVNNSVDKFSYQKQSTVEGATKVRRAYQDTVMSVSHYTKEYGDTYTSSISEELGSDLAIALKQSSELSSILKSTLVTQIENTIESRKQLQNTVQVEQDSIESHHTDLYDVGEFVHECMENQIQSSNIEHINGYKRKYSNIGEKLDNIAIIRQEDINKVNKLSQTSQLSSELYSYFYQSLSTDFPVLEIIGRLGRKHKRLKFQRHNRE
jgi:hypothetical protein